jgi:long-chain fatty acid transport protein
MKNMKKITAMGAILLMTTSIATAGGLDRSGQPIGIIFEDGDVVQLSFGMITPNVSGTATGPSLTGASGNMANSYVQIGLGYKQQLTDQLSLALIFDQPYGASVSYENASGGYYATGTAAEVTAKSINAVVRYSVNDRISVHGGMRYQTVTANVTKSTATAGVFYNIDTEASSAVGYLLGAAYEIPDIALRVALTYNSTVTHDIVGTETFGGAGGPATTSQVTTPQSVNLDFQTGVAADTLVFGSIRWAEWTAFDFNPAAHNGAYGVSLQDYDNDTIAYSIGLGRKFNDEWSGALTVGYEAETGGFAGNLAPTDGNISVGLGGTYTMSDATKITGGLRYIMLGDADTEHPGAQGITGSEFRDNTAVAVGLSITTSF